MIGKIKGKLAELNEDVGLIETPAGIFYEVYLPSNVLMSVVLQREIEIYTYLYVREDIMELFGFADKRTHTIFKLLLSVSGVGAKTAFHITSVLKTDEIIQAIRENDTSVLTRVKGLGKKTAMKIILELAQKFDAEFEFERFQVSDDDQIVIDALKSLGFSVKDIEKEVEKMPNDLEIEEKIKLGIQKLS